jgi:hypothetical protein
LAVCNIKLSDASKLTSGVLATLGVEDVGERKMLLTAWAPSPEAAAAQTDEKVRRQRDQRAVCVCVCVCVYLGGGEGKGQRGNDGRRGCGSTATRRPSLRVSRGPCRC